MNAEKLARLKLDHSAKRRSRATVFTILLGVAIITAAALLYAQPWSKERQRVFSGTKAVGDPAAPGKARTPGSLPTHPAVPPSAFRPAAGPRTNSLLTVSGYIVNRERIELSPRFMGVVKWIGVKKGDAVTNGQVVVTLDDSEYRARQRELEGRFAQARVAVHRAEIELKRTDSLVENRVETQRALDLARLDLEAAQAQVKTLEGDRQTLDTYLDWCVIRSPINGVVLEKLTEANELVTPQSFGGTRGPSTALISVADPNDLQVEIDLNEADVSKVFLGQECRVSPEAYLDHSYRGTVAEIAPEASRQKGTLQIKVQILDPDKYLTPELSAKVDFLDSAKAAPSHSR